MLLSLAGKTVLMVVLVPLMSILAFVVIINVLQSNKPNWLRWDLTSWDFLPLWMHSLEPVDKVLRNVGSICCGCCAEKCSCLTVQPEKKSKVCEEAFPDAEIGNENPAFQQD